MWPRIPDSYQKLPESDSGSFRYTRSRDYQTPTRHALLGSGRCWKTGGLCHLLSLLTEVSAGKQPRHSPSFTSPHSGTPLSHHTRRVHFKLGPVTSRDNWDPQWTIAGCHVKHSANKQFTLPFKFTNETWKKPSRLVWMGLQVILDWVNASDNWQLLHTRAHAHTQTH